MIIRRSAAGSFVTSACLAVMLVGCAQTPMGPTVQVMPGPGKSFDAFQADQANCKGYAAGQVQGQADAANQQAVGAGVLGTVLGAGLGAAVGGAAGNAGAGAAIGAASGAGLGAAYGANGSSYAQMSIQQQYDNAFAQCMYAKGEQVPGLAPLTPPPPPPTAGGRDSLVQATQSELIRLGYLQGAADGYMGPKTHGAIASFEQAKGLPADGSPSPSLLARLQSTPTGAPPPPATASAPSNWVAPAGSPGAAPSPAASGPAAAPAGGWVAPAKTP